jgi:hypothetical protein
MGKPVLAEMIHLVQMINSCLRAGGIGRVFLVEAVNSLRYSFCWNLNPFMKGHIWEKSFNLPCNFCIKCRVVVSESRACCSSPSVSRCFVSGKAQVRVVASNLILNTVPWVEGKNAFLFVDIRALGGYECPCRFH